MPTVHADYKQRWLSIEIIDTWWKYRYLTPTRKYRQYRYLVSVSCPSQMASSVCVSYWPFFVSVIEFSGYFYVTVRIHCSEKV